MNNILTVNIIDRLAQLADDHDDSQFGQDVVFVGDSVEQLTAFYAEIAPVIVVEHK